MIGWDETGVVEVGYGHIAPVHGRSYSHYKGNETRIRSTIREKYYEKVMRTETHSQSSSLIVFPSLFLTSNYGVSVLMPFSLYASRPTARSFLTHSHCVA